jgi:hypothetical protein
MSRPVGASTEVPLELRAEKEPAVLITSVRLTPAGVMT